MLTSIATVSLSGDLELKLHAIAQAGFEGAEIFENDLLTCSRSARDIRKLMSNLGLSCTMFQPFRDFEGMPPARRARVFERVERKFDLMQELGADLLLVCSNVSAAALPERERIVGDLHELGERAAKRGLRVGYEALAWGLHVFDHRDAWSIVKEVNHPAVGLVLDSFHSLARGILVDTLRDIDPTRIFVVQLADAPLVQMDYLTWSRHLRNMPGQGDLALVDYVATLVEVGYKGPLSLEIFNDRFRGASAASVAIDGRRALANLCDQVHRRLAPLGMPVMPPRVQTRNVEFVEFAATEDEAVQLGALFGSLGFSAVGQHRSKAVTRWRQNGINFVINTEPEGFAHAHGAAHGASICALGMSVDDVGGALKRAHGLRIQTAGLHVREKGTLPAIMGVGGSLLYLVEAGSELDIWEREFEPLNLASGVDWAGLLRVDHVVQTIPYEEMLSWLLFYTSLFEVAKSPIVQVADLLGLVQSQAIESPSGDVRITLNGSASPQTLSARFLRGTGGAGVQHIALMTADIFATARALRDRGLETLPIPTNYYEDIEARFELDPQLLKQLVEHGILYDRDTDGEYFQLYSRAFARRFFFEIVERRGYRAYGSTNAPIRLAAQSRYRADA